jgi:enoyl-CoA hydratase
MSSVQYAVDGRVARITLNRPDRGNGINRGLITELEQSVEGADLDPAVSVLLLSGNGKGFCGGYDLVQRAEGQGQPEGEADLGDAASAAVRARDEDFGDLGASTFKG